MDAQQISFEYAADLCKQLITLSTGLLGLSITFLKDIVKLNPAFRGLLQTSWGLLLLSIGGGLLALMGMTGSLASHPDPEASVMASTITIPAMIQTATFFIAVVLLVLYGIRNRRTGA